MTSEFAQHRTLDPAVAVLNHSSYGAAAHNEAGQCRELAAALPRAIGAGVA